MSWPRLGAGVLMTGWLLASASGADGGYPVRYRFVAGQQLTYETRTTTEGRFTLQSGDGPVRTLPMSVEVSDRVTYRVSQLKPDGSAWLMVTLSQLHLQSSGVGGGVVFEVADTGDGIRVRLGEQTWLVKRPGDDAPDDGLAETVLAPGFTVHDARMLTSPSRLLVSPAGEVLERQGRSWRDRLEGVAILGVLTPLLQPFGPGLPELPGKTMPVGQEWEQHREVGLPGSDETYSLKVGFVLGGTATVGPYQAVEIDFTGSARVQDLAFAFEPLPGLSLPMTVQLLTHDLTGRAAFDAERGRLIEQHLVSKVRSSSQAERGQPFTLQADVAVDATMLLLTVEEPAAAP